MLPLPVALVARLLPVVVLAAAGLGLTTGSRPQTHHASATPQRPSVKAQTLPAYAKPPSACAAVPAGTVRKFVPGAGTAGKALKASDPKRRSGCSWHALRGFDYRWLDVAFEIAPASPAADGSQQRGAEQAAEAIYAGRKAGPPVSGLGDEASAGTKLTEDDGQQTRGAVVVLRQANAVVTVTYSGSDFETRKAPDPQTMREGALAAAKDALAALGAGSS